MKPQSLESARVMDDDGCRVMCAEATAFAFALLMPADWLRRDIKKMGGIDIEDEKKLAKLCKMYRVSMPMMVLRIGQVMK